MSEIKIGDHVKCIDGSYSLVLSGKNKFKHLFGIELKTRSLIVEKIFCATNNIHDVILRDINSDEIILHTKSMIVKTSQRREPLPIDHPVFVKSPFSRQWFRRHFAGWDKQGNMMVWNNGSTSHSYCSNNILRDNIDNESVMGEFVSSFSAWYWED